MTAAVHDLEELIGKRRRRTVITIGVDDEVDLTSALGDLNDDRTAAIDAYSPGVGPLRLRRRIVDPGGCRRRYGVHLEGAIARGTGDVEDGDIDGNGDGGRRDAATLK